MGFLIVVSIYFPIDSAATYSDSNLQTTMFYTHTEATTRISYWFLMNGTAQIFNGLVTYGVYNVDPNKIHPWRLYMIITGGLTLLLGLAFWFLIPDSPLRARFLTHEEKIIAIERLRNQSTGTENKTWKKDQFIEALTDWKTWARGVLLFAIYLGGTGVPAYVLALAWCASSSTGHTKKTTANAMLQIGYCEILFYTACCFIDGQAGVGNLISPQIWRAQYAPRYLVPWAIILASRVISPILLLVIRYYLNKENRRRDALQAEVGEAERFFDENGNEIDTTFLDITDVSRSAS
ncbi:hypothetical protein I305_02034 [Cryptococcus gattii E566]|uniref:MFS transporter, putative n=2 Tax=Cryptococcus gattii TaxID=37769 RepID=E6RD23_CRYGW|nr:MFS transporter, putative [Cryptococcus gattii WM276]ADV24803.1 MFS transporter, putative [Cryptococcus gattii WM276]KIR79342.1 hypothetical protein I306_03615 [Cryptococcus gattii EJB2]KIY35129.1 hypothetical protein I305_02034 [Cryptococcus gattii E566]KJE00080.1 hypothetical protein I311_06317 [Cryptococcus gattii NT-10]